MNIKALHFDMKAVIPKLDHALELIDIFAEQGFNTIILEFEDKFPFEATRGFHHPAAWSKDDFRRLAQHCKKCNVEIVPLMQSIGHLDYLLKYPAFQHLRDGGAMGTTYQWCLALEASYELWQKMTDEILEVFPDTKTFHIGADECRMREPCQRCGENKLDFYIKRVARCVEYIQSQNMKAVIWDDVFRKYGIEQFKRLPSGVVCCVWLYREIDWQYVEKIAGMDIELWGASSLQANKNNYVMNPHEIKMDNVDDWGRINQKYPRFTGHIATLWGRNQCLSPYNTNLTQAVLMTAYCGKTLTDGLIADRKEFINSYGRDFFGVELDYFTMIRYFNYEPAIAGKILAELCEKALYHRSIAEILQAFNKMDELLDYMDMCFSNNLASLASYRNGGSPPELTSNWSDGVRIAAERCEKLYNDLTPVITRYFCKNQWDELWEQHFAARLEQNQYWGKVIEEAKQKWQQNLQQAAGQISENLQK